MVAPSADACSWHAYDEGPGDSSWTLVCGSVDPYNTVLCMNYLLEHTDVTIMMDPEALYDKLILDSLSGSVLIAEVLSKCLMFPALVPCLCVWCTAANCAALATTACSRKRCLDASKKEAQTTPTAASGRKLCARNGPGNTTTSTSLVAEILGASLLHEQ